MKGTPHADQGNNRIVCAVIEKPRHQIDSGVFILYLVGRAGVEPTTNGLKGDKTLLYQ